MKKIVNGSLVCEFKVDDNFSFYSEVDCEYENDTIRYAVEKFFAHAEDFNKSCTRQSWECRIAKRRNDRKRKFSYVVAASSMELPGTWVQVMGQIDQIGACVRKVKICGM